MVRVQKLLASWGVASRRAIERYIRQGRIAVDGKILSEQGFLVDEENLPEITFDGGIIQSPKKMGYTILAFNKPKLVITTLKDEKNRRSIADFLPKESKRLYPIGRLDYDSTGLLLITDYGELTNRLLHPSFKVNKEYWVRINGEKLTKEEMQLFSAGIELEDGFTAPCKIRALEMEKSYSVIIREGRKRQVKRMFEYFNRKVIRLNRVSFGPIKLGDLPVGKIRELTKKETAALLKTVGL